MTKEELIGRFQQRLRMYRLMAGKTQVDMAKELNVSRRSYIYYERGKDLPPTDKICKIASVLKIDPGNFFAEGELTLHLD